MKTLIVIDMQNDFIDGVLGTAEAQAIVPKVKQKIKEYLSNGDKVIFTRDTHTDNYLNTYEGKKLPIPHCIKGTDGWQISKELDDAKCAHIDKPNFGYRDWEFFYYLMDCGDIELVGVCTDICVISNAMILKAIFPENNILVDASCCAGTTPDNHTNALNAMRMCQIDIINTEV
jgi:nicotinamidase-related amidase